MRSLFAYLVISIMIAPSFLAFAPRVGAQGTTSAAIDVTAPTSCLYLDAGAYGNPQSGIGQISSNGRGAAVCSWSLSRILTTTQHVTISFEMLTNVPVAGSPNGPLVTGSIYLTAAAPASLDPIGLWAHFTSGTKMVTADADCCAELAFLNFQSQLWNESSPCPPPETSASCALFDRHFSGFADDNVFHSYTIDMDLQSNSTTWTADGGAATANYMGLAFVPTQLVFYARSTDDGNSMITQIRNIIVSPGVNPTGPVLLPFADNKIAHFTDMRGDPLTSYPGNEAGNPLLGFQYHLILNVSNPDTVTHTYSISVQQDDSVSQKTGGPAWPDWLLWLGLPTQWDANPSCIGTSPSLSPKALCESQAQTVTIQPGGATRVTFTFTNKWSWIAPFDIKAILAEVMMTIATAGSPELVSLGFDGLAEALGESYFIINEKFHFNVLSSGTVFGSFDQNMTVPAPKRLAEWASFTSSEVAGWSSATCIWALATGVGAIVCIGALPLQVELLAAQSFEYTAAYDPDPDYTNIVVPGPLTLNNGTLFVNLPTVSSAPAQWKAVEESLARAVSFQNATTISAARYFGALEVGDLFFADLQYQVMTKYAVVRDEAIASFETQLSSVAYQFPPLNSSAVRLIHDYLVENGLPLAERQMLSGLGLSESIDGIAKGMMALNETVRNPAGLSAVSIDDSVSVLQRALVTETNSFASQQQLSQRISLSSYYTDGNGYKLSNDAQGSPMINVVFKNGQVSSTSPSEVLAWVNITDNGEVPLQSIKLNLTLPLDWSVTPSWMPAQGSIHVYFANAANLTPNSEITQPSTITVSEDNPEKVQLAIPSLNATAVGYPLMRGQAILLSVKMSYALAGTSQIPKSYARYYPNIASSAVWTQTSYGGSEALSTSSASFKAYAKIQSEGSPPLTILGLQPTVFYGVAALAIVSLVVIGALTFRRMTNHESTRHNAGSCH